MKSMKRSLAFLLAIFLLFGAMTGIGAATNEISSDTGQQEEITVEASETDADKPPDDFGTVTDASGEEHPIPSPVWTIYSRRIRSLSP